MLISETNSPVLVHVNVDLDKDLVARLTALKNEQKELGLPVSRYSYRRIFTDALVAFLHEAEGGEPLRMAPQNPQEEKAVESLLVLLRDRSRDAERFINMVSSVLDHYMEACNPGKSTHPSPETAAPAKAKKRASR